LKVSYKSYFVGLLSGVLFTIAGLLVLANIATSRMANRLGISETVLASPAFPDLAQLTAYGQPDWDWSLYTLDGKQVPFASFRGKTLFITYWATWCRPCVSELPSIQRLHDSLKNEPIEFLLITDEHPGAVQYFLSKRQFSLPVYRQQGQTPPLFRSIGVPATFIVSRDGALVFKHTGAARWDDPACLAFLRSLATPAPAH